MVGSIDQKVNCKVHQKRKGIYRSCLKFSAEAKNSNFVKNNHKRCVLQSSKETLNNFIAYSSGKLGVFLRKLLPKYIGSCIYGYGVVKKVLTMAFFLL